MNGEKPPSHDQDEHDLATCAAFFLETSEHERRSYCVLFIAALFAATATWTKI